MSQYRRIAIIQNFIPEYRIAIFERIGLLASVKLDIIHSGAAVEGEFSFNQIICKKYSLGPLIYQKGLLKTLKKYDLVVAMFDIRWISIVFAQLYCNFQKTPFILWGHGLGRSKMLSKVRLFLAKRADALILYDKRRSGPFLAAGLKNLSIFEAGNTIHIPNAGHNPDAIRDGYIFVGRLYKEKKLEQLIKSFASISNSQLKLRIVGSGEQEEALKRLVKELGISNQVIFCGKILDHNKLKAIFDKSIAYVSPGIVGLGVLHSFAYGVPVVTFKNQNHGPEFENLNESNSILYDGTSEGLTKVLTKMSVESKSSKDLGANAFDYYSTKRTIYNMLEGFENAFDFVGPVKRDANVVN